MKVAKFFALAGILSMTAILIFAFSSGNFLEEGSVLLSMPWGIVSLVDLYVGFILFSLWIVYRERIWWHAVVWVILMMLLGFFTGSLYTYLALQNSNGNWKKFWLGKNVDLL